LPTYEDVCAAQARVQVLARRTPLLEAAALNEVAGGRLLLKTENLQATGSFKIRGATNALAQLTPDVRARGVIAFSSGNHAQAVARAARHYGVPAVIVMPADAPAPKIARTRTDGAEVVLYDRDHEDREGIAHRLGAERGLTMIKPYDHPHTIAGQGTVALELFAQAAEQGISLDGVAVCCGGGGLTAGIGLVVKTLSPQTQLWAAEPEAFDDTRQSLVAQRRVQVESAARRSICDALMAPTPGELTFALNQRQLTGVATTSDTEIIATMRLAWEHVRLVLEPGGAAALSVALHGHVPLQGKTWGIVLTGGNVALADFTKWVD